MTTEHIRCIAGLGLGVVVMAMMSLMVWLVGWMRAFLLLALVLILVTELRVLELGKRVESLEASVSHLRSQQPSQ